MKVSELAKELGMKSRDLLEKAASMNIEAKAANSNLSDIDATALRNMINAKKNKEAETKIVRVASKKSDSGGETKPRVELKVAKVASSSRQAPAPRKKPASRPQPEQIPEDSAFIKKPPVGKPVPKSGARPPVGRPVPKKTAEKRDEEEKAAAAAKAREAEAAKAREAEAAKAAETEKEVTPEKDTAAVRPEAVKAAAASPEASGKENSGAQAAPARERTEGPAAPAKEKTSGPAAPGGEKTAAQNAPAREKPAAPAAPQKEKANKNPDRRTGQEIKVLKRASELKKEKEAEEKAASAGASSKSRPQRSGQGQSQDRNKRTGDRTGNKPQGARPAAQGGKNDKDSKNKAQFSKKHKDKDKEKEKNRYDRLDREPRSLEKKAKKKHFRPKPEPEQLTEEEVLPAGTKVINVPITIAGFCEQTGVSVSTVILTLLKMGIVANQNQNIDDVTVEMLAEELGIRVVIGKVEEEEEEEGLELFEDRESDLRPRPPVITVMGHVDHGKTSLLDAIRNTDVTAGESGGITQHIGASEVWINGQKIVFLDTPGHEAFTAMRARGADITDIAVLVVAADDSVKPQTVESISHAKAAGVPIIVAINKMDKPGADPDRVKQDLTEHGVLVEEWGGDVISVPVSAKTGEGIKSLLEMILLQAEMLELKANPDRLAMGTVIEARLDKAKGPVATLLVMNGTLKTGQSVVAGTCSGRIRLMTNYKGETIRKAGPATAVEILGLTDVPAAGDKFNAVGDDKKAREIAESRRLKQREEVMARTSSSTLEELFSQIKEGERKELNLIVKGDVMGSVGAVNSSLEKLSNDEVRVNIVHSGVGAINESDVILAGTSDAVIIGFNVRPQAAVSSLADQEGVQIRTYNVIYNIIDDVENALKGMLDPEFKEVVLGEAEIRDTFRVPGAGTVAGSYVTRGKVVRNSGIRLIREGIVIHEGKIASLRRFKDDAREVAQGYECGIGLENYNDIKIGDVIECFEMREVERDS